MNLRVGGVLLAASLAVTMVTGCAAKAPVAGGSDEMAGLMDAAREQGLGADHPTVQRLADGVVTLEEYNQGVADEIGCLDDHGLTVVKQYVNKLDSWRVMVESQPSEPAASGDADWSSKCSVEYVMLLELGYSLTSPNRIDAPLLADAQPCLSALNPPSNGTERSMDDLVATTGNRSAVTDCLWDSLVKLYPGEGMADAA